MSSFTNPNHGPNNPAGQEGQQQSGLDQTRQQVDEVVDIMRNNVEKGKSLELLLSYESYALFLAYFKSPRKFFPKKLFLDVLL